MHRVVAAQPLTTEQLVAFCNSAYEAKVDGNWANLCHAQDQLPPPLLNALNRAEADHRLALISACNPYSQSLDDAENATRQAALRTAIATLDHPCWAGRGRAQDFSWVEDSWLVRASLKQIDAWARQFQQHAVYLPAQGSLPASLRIYSLAADGIHVPQMGKLRLEWVGCDPPFPA